MIHLLRAPVRGATSKKCILWIAVLLALSANGAQSARPKQRLINKCCRIGDHLTQDKVCVAGGGSEKWAPKVFMTFSRPPGYFNRTGELPGFIKVTEAAFPQTCKNPELFNGNFVLIANASLFSTEKNRMFDPDVYCVDKDVALVCTRNDLGDPESLVEAPQLIKVKKCCGPQQAFTEHSSSPCATLDKNHTLYSAKIIESGMVDISYAFPKCELNEFGIAGPFMLSNFDPETGSIVTESGKRLQSDQYCLDNVLDENRGVSILTCSKHFAGDSSVHVEDARFAVYSVGLLISVVFLLATIIAGFLVLSNHHALHWRCQTNYVACLLVGDLLLAITQMTGNSITGVSCAAIGE